MAAPEGVTVDTGVGGVKLPEPARGAHALNGGRLGSEEGAGRGDTAAHACEGPSVMGVGG